MHELEKLLEKEVIINTNDNIVYSGILAKMEGEKVKLRDAHIVYSPKLTAEQVLSRKSIRELELSISNIKKYQTARWTGAGSPGR
jgi:small nuclear ribonucleoprotein (snRNP)-like protein